MPPPIESTPGTSTPSGKGRYVPSPPPFQDSDPEQAEESAAAKAKRIEAEQERLNQYASAESSGGGGGEYEPVPVLPRWEPRRPPPGHGPGSIDDTLYDPPSAATPPIKSDGIPDEPPPGYY